MAWEDVLNWGWKLVDCQLTPVMSDVSAVPQKLLKMIHCNCKTACGQCQLKTCDNRYNLAHQVTLTKRRMKIVIDNVYAFNSYFRNISMSAAILLKHGVRFRSAIHNHSPDGSADHNPSAKTLKDTEMSTANPNPKP